MLYLLFLLFGFIGVVLRYNVNSWLLGVSPIPLGTLVVNVLGSFLLGLIFQQQQISPNPWSQPLVMALMVGFLGALTTFSGFAFDTMRLFQGGQYLWASVNIAANNILCLLFCYIGYKSALKL